MDTIRLPLLRNSILLLLSAGAVGAMAADKAATTEPSLLRLVLALAFVVGLILVLAWILKRTPVARGQAVIKVVSSTSVGAREKILLIQVGDQQLLIGVTAHQINTLHELSTPVSLPEPTSGMAFAEALHKVIKSRRE